jgi:SAM-dependent methyltransferase
VDAGRVDLGVSRDDVMFQFQVRSFVLRGQTLQQAFVVYLLSGLHMRQVLEAITRRKFGGLAGAGSVLDFASGYGRLTRFLVTDLDPARVWVSDVKPRAVEFQRRAFGVNGFVSAPDPEALVVGERFDCIFVGSLFSHLPESTFGRWLQWLCDLLSPRGVLIVSVHDAGLLDSAAGGHTYRPESEETHARTADGPLDPAHYGGAYVTEAFVREVIDGLTFEDKRYTRFPKGLWDTQDVYVLARDGIDLSGVTLPTI